MIQINNLYKAFDERIILNGVSLHLKERENLCILGKSGAGKSVLVKCIVRLIEPDFGEIKVMGQDILSMNYSDLTAIRKEIGYLFQGGALYDSMSVRENLEFPIRRTELAYDLSETEARIEKALRSVGLLDTIDKMPSELSGGMRKRLSLARALILRPKVILYDEPTTGLDSVTSGEISELILQIREEYNASSIIITHDMKCAKITADRVKVLLNGNFVAEGSYDELNNSSNKSVRDFFM